MIEAVPAIQEQTALLKDIAALLKRQQLNEMPGDHVLWTPEDIAGYLQVSARTVVDRYVPQPDFPLPTKPGGGYPRYYAVEVIEWASRARLRKPKHA